MRKFILSCESTVDMPYSYFVDRDIPVIFYSYVVDGKEYIDDMQRDPEALPRFYKFLEEGKLPSTSQINYMEYYRFFEEQSAKGDLLHVVFGSGMTQSIRNAELAARDIKKTYPNRKIILIDSLCSSSGYGMLVDYAADMLDEGKSIDEVTVWLNSNKKRIHHQFFSTQLDFYRRSGRMSGPTAAIATILDICPIMKLDDKGKIVAYDKVRGKIKAIKRTVDVMEKHAENGKDYSGKCFICHSNCMDIALKTKEEIASRFANINADNIKIFDIGTIIASHTGTGTCAVFFVGDERTSEK